MAACLACRRIYAPDVLAENVYHTWNVQAHNDAPRFLKAATNYCNVDTIYPLYHGGRDQWLTRTSPSLKQGKRVTWMTSNGGQYQISPDIGANS